MAHVWTRQEKVKRAVWAVAFTAVILVGSVTGAQLKTDKQKQQAISEFRQSSLSEQIATLETQREYLVQQKLALQRKLDLFRERVISREADKSPRAR